MAAVNVRCVMEPAESNTKPCLGTPLLTFKSSVFVEVIP